MGMLRPLGETGMLTVDSPFSVSGAEKVPVAMAPGFGEHGAEILREAGLKMRRLTCCGRPAWLVGERPEGLFLCLNPSPIDVQTFGAMFPAVLHFVAT